MNLPFTFARRYFVSKKSSNAINLISWVSVLGMLVGSLGLILVLSVFNGFEGLVISLYNAFNPDLVITVKEGKSFTPDSARLAHLESLHGVKAVSKVIEENALFTYGDKQYIGVIKGVEDNYGSVTRIDSSMYDGVFELHRGDQPFAVIGAGIAQALGVNFADPFSRIVVYIPKKGKATVINPEDAFNQEVIKPAGSFAIQSEFDSKYVFLPLSFARKLTGYSSAVSSLEVAVAHGVSADAVQQKIESLFGDSFTVRNRLEQNLTLYKVMKTEKWAVYAILTLILIIAAFNIIGSLSMLLIEKKKDISILRTMGADDRLIQRIFLSEGMLLSLVGCLSGFLIAFLLIEAQQHFEWLKMVGSSFVIDAYPVEMKGRDFVLVFFTVMVIGFLAAWFPAYRATKTPLAIVKD